jgi:hypothetical protein
MGGRGQVAGGKWLCGCGAAAARRGFVRGQHDVVLSGGSTTWFCQGTAQMQTNSQAAAEFMQSLHGVCLGVAGGTYSCCVRSSQAPRGGGLWCARGRGSFSCLRVFAGVCAPLLCKKFWAPTLEHYTPPTLL